MSKRNTSDQHRQRTPEPTTYRYTAAMEQRDPILFRDLTRRQVALLVCVVNYITLDTNHAHTPPTFRSVIQALNLVLPPGLHGRPAVSSKQQVQKWSMRLRELGYLHTIAELNQGKNLPNLVPTPAGYALVRDYQAHLITRYVHPLPQASPESS